MRGERLRVFTGNAHPQLANDICGHMGIPLGATSLTPFPDGEINLKVECDVRGADVFVVQPTCPPVHDNLFELLAFADCLRRASADRITAVIPYFGYARKDRKDEGRVPINAKLVANLITTAGFDRVVSVDLHAAQIQGFFDIPFDHLYARPVLIDLSGSWARPTPSRRPSAFAKSWPRKAWPRAPPWCSATTCARRLPPSPGSN